MTDPGCFRDDEPARMLALFRYGVIAPLAEREDLARGEVSALVEEIAGRTHYRPGKGPVRVSPRTVYGWWRSYRSGGIEALRPKRRKDHGQSRVLEAKLLERAVALRQENPKRTTTTLLDILDLEQHFAQRSAPHRATLDRHLARRGVSRRQMKVFATAPTIRLHVDHFGDLWLGDYHHGPLVLGPDGQPTTSKLGAFLDHASRYPVADRYYLAEDLATLRDSLLRALLRWGPSEKVYVDRGAVYRSDQLAYSLQRIGTQLVHSRAYYSQGRGAIERWWQTIAAFEDEVAARPELLTLHELNRLWEAYRERRYCEVRHSSLGRSPNEAVADVTPRPLDPQLARELFLVRVDRKVHRKDATVAVLGRRFLCDGSLRGRRVDVRFDPSDLGSVLIFDGGQRLQRAFPQPLNARPEPPPVQELPPPTVDYLALVRQDYDRKLLERARPLAYAELSTDPGFTVEHYLDVVRQLAGLTPQPATDREIRDFWDTFGPLPESLVRSACEHAVRLHGRGRHARVYLHALKTLVLAHWKQNRKETP